MMGAVERRMVLWTLVVFFGASIVFKLVNDATDGEHVALRAGFQLLALVAVLVAVVVVVRRRG